jgi:two-component system response regulator DesR
MAATPIRILCVDDNELVCGALQRKFAGTSGFEWCGALPDASVLVPRALECRPHVVLMDMDMPGPDPLGEVRRLGGVLPECRVLVLSGLLTASLVERALAAGAGGYLSKAAASSEIVDAVERAAAGEMVLSPEVRMYYAASGRELERREHVGGLGPIRP